MMFSIMYYMACNVENNKANKDNDKYDKLYSYGYICNECLAVYLSVDDFGYHVNMTGHSKEATRLDLLSCSRISDNKVLALFSLPNES